MWRMSRRFLWQPGSGLRGYARNVPGWDALRRQRGLRTTNRNGPIPLQGKGLEEIKCKW